MTNMSIVKWDRKRMNKLESHIFVHLDNIFGAQSWKLNANNVGTGIDGKIRWIQTLFNCVLLMRLVNFFLTCLMILWCPSYWNMGNVNMNADGDKIRVDTSHSRKWL